jgi:uncharacterized membrane protein
MVRLSSVAAGALSLGLFLACGDKQNPNGDFHSPGGAGDAAAGGVSYAKTIAPLMARSCAVSGCHDATTRMAGVALDNYDDVKTNAQVSNTEIQSQNMPVGSVPSLTDTERQSFDSWVQAGAPNN